MKKILIIGAGFLQSFIVRKAKEMGYYTIAIDKNPASVGFSYADEYGVIDIVDKESCLEFAKEKSIDGVITAATDYGVLSVAYIAQEMNLPGIDYEVAEIIKNKFLVRCKLSESIPSSVLQYYEVDALNEIEKIGESIRYPVMIKPSDGSGSRAAKRVNGISEFKSACSESIKASLIGRAFIEDFVEGKEYGVESFVYNGDVHVLAVMGKHMTNPPDYSELGHFMPSQLDIEYNVKDVVSKSIKTLGINYGAVNMDILITKDGKVCIIDVGARMGGNLIGSHIVPIGTGIDYMGNLIRASVNDSIDLKPKCAATNIATRILALDPGKVLALPDFEQIKRKCKVDIYHNIKVGDIIHEYHNNLDGCGYVVAIANDIKDAEERAEKAKQLINNGIVRNCEISNNYFEEGKTCIAII